MNKLEIMAMIVELQWKLANYYITESEIREELDKIYFELENMEVN